MSCRKGNEYDSESSLHEARSASARPLAPVFRLRAIGRTRRADPRRRADRSRDGTGGGEGFELRIPEGAKEIDRSSVPDPDTGASLDEVVFLYGGDTFTFRSEITGRLENISPFPDDYVRGEHDDLIPPETPRCICDRAEGSGVLLWLSGDRMFSLSVTEGAASEKLNSLRLLLIESPET